jgi:hypothetical protein
VTLLGVGLLTGKGFGAGAGRGGNGTDEFAGFPNGNLKLLGKRIGRDKTPGMVRDSKTKPAPDRVAGKTTAIVG